MLTLVSQPTDAIKQFRAKPWPFQQTFKTPLKTLNSFVSTFLAPFSAESGLLSTDEVVFEPTTIQQLLANNSARLEDPYRFAIEASGKNAVAELLEAAFSDWLDFTFLPFPEDFAIYADHDEYTTFYSRDRAALKGLAGRLRTAGFDTVNDYTRGGLGE